MLKKQKTYLNLVILNLLTPFKQANYHGTNETLNNEVYLATKSFIFSSTHGERLTANGNYTHSLEYKKLILTTLL